MTLKLLTRFLLTLLTASALHGCSTPMRAPICAEGEYEFPPGIEGRYRYSMLGKNTGMSGALSNLEDFEFEILETPDHYMIEFSSANAVLPHHLFTRSADPDKQGTGEEMHFTFATCRIGNQYYGQFRNEDSTYMISRMDVSPTGLTTSPLAWSAESLKANRFTYYAFPLYDYINGDGKFSFGNGFVPVQLIIDNSSLTPERREHLISLGHSTVAGYVFSRVQPEEQKRKGNVRRFRLNKQ